MSSGRQLRCTIRPPIRYRESEAETRTSALLNSMHLAREVSASTYPQKFIPQNKISASRRVAITTKPEIVEFDPALPPAVFSTLSGPQSVERKINQKESDEKEARETHSPFHVDWDVSNCGFNQTYKGNMVAMATAGKNEFDLADNLSVSDTDDEPADDQITLGLKVSSRQCYYLNAKDTEMLE